MKLEERALVEGDTPESAMRLASIPHITSVRICVQVYSYCFESFVLLISDSSMLVVW